MKGPLVLFPPQVHALKVSKAVLHGCRGLVGYARHWPWGVFNPRPLVGVCLVFCGAQH